MKAKLLDINGKEKKIIELPKCFSAKIRRDIVEKVIESKKFQQPYAPSLVAGKQHSASGVLIHQRKVWKSQYGRGMSRVPRKIMSRKGSQFNWVGAEASNTRGGRRPHPPKVLSRMGKLKINKKELRIALISAISATVNEKRITSRYETLKGKTLNNFPFVVESKLTQLGTKDLIASLKKILGELFELGIQKKKVRSGKGTRRGRKYKKNAGLLLVRGDQEKIKTTAFDTTNVSKLSVVDLAKGGVGRITVYTEDAIKELGEKLK